MRSVGMGSFGVPPRPLARWSLFPRSGRRAPESGHDALTERKAIPGRRARRPSEVLTGTFPSRTISPSLGICTPDTGHRPRLPSMSDSLPLFPLHAVLVPGAALGLRAAWAMLQKRYG